MPVHIQYMIGALRRLKRLDLRDKSNFYKNELNRKYANLSKKEIQDIQDICNLNETNNNWFKSFQRKINKISKKIAKF